MQLTEADKQRINALLNKTPQPAEREIRALAEALALAHADEYVKAIQSAVSKLAARRQMEEQRAQMVYYPLVEPPRPPTSVIDENGIAVNTTYYRQTFHVRLVDLPAFCKAHGLNETRLREVGAGQRHDEKGWTRAATPATGYAVGQMWKEPTPPDTTDWGHAPKAKGFRPSYRYAQPATIWQPDQGADSQDK